ncbi:hypothetical protein M433DRAFT_7991 [Acidomyces richmondensis BFW]|nr:hypothetical protein M433DRAFT_7991 [Acidomyces richmondensis BFW]
MSSLMSRETAPKADFELAQQVLNDKFKYAGESSHYQTRRLELLRQESRQSWDFIAKASASEVEQEAQDIIFKIREHERLDPGLYGNNPGEAIPDPSTADMGGRFLANKPRIERSKVFDIAKAMPKGCHLHIHFNTELPPEILFPHARKLPETFYIRTTNALLHPCDYNRAEMMFNVFPADHAKADCFSDQYNPEWKSGNNNPWMLWADFRAKFPKNLIFENRPNGLDDAECWAREKMVVTRERTYNSEQTLNGIWACFNIGTRAFKGLMNYESVYRWYIGQAIESMIRDKVMYAELRPMLLDKSIPSDDGTRQLDHFAQMSIICEEIQKKRSQLEADQKIDCFPFGLKIIYCTPRMIPIKKMQSELSDCIKLKLAYPHLICGFDLVGAEDRPNSIGFYANVLVAFQETCKQLNISIPFMFHAGESLLDTGGSCNPENSNLYDSLLLHAKRVGHGYSLLKHPLLIEKFKKQNICLELCPISNELLHLCGNVRQHPYPALLAAGLPCTLNADNPSLFRGAAIDSHSLSFEFYQVMVGDTRMTIHGWKQLAQWSIEHSCLSDCEKARAMEIFGRDWEAFCKHVVATYQDDAAAITLPGE